jgi:NADPH:quinone reductase
LRAVVVHAFGPPSQLVATDEPDPSAGPGQALIDVAFANVTFVDTQIRAGRPPNPAMLPSLPAILGNGVGGVVAGVGDPDHEALVGRRVVASLGGAGGYAQPVGADVGALIDNPLLSTPDALALLADDRTAMPLMRAAALRPG